MKGEAEPLQSGMLCDEGTLLDMPAASPYHTAGLQRLTSSSAVNEVSPAQLLIADVKSSLCQACGEIASSIGYEVTYAENVTQARSIMKCQQVDVLIVDLNSFDGASLMVDEMNALRPEVVVLPMTTLTTVCSAEEAVRVGALAYLTRPFAVEELTAVLTRVWQRWSFDVESRKLHVQLRKQNASNLIGHSPEMKSLYRVVLKVAVSNYPVLITGESGTGKELVARSIHFSGPNADQPFIPVDCGSLVSTLIESELFGHVKGAFTGANTNKLGLLAAADGGTVFLDEIGELPLDVQSKLLRALQEKEVRPVGSNQTVRITARILAATHSDLAAMVAQGRFRSDLYYRINVVKIKVPSLRERRPDIPLLVEHFLKQNVRKSGLNYSLSKDVLRVMTEYMWPGNVRELEHAIARACALSSGLLLNIGDLPTQLQNFLLQSQTLAPAAREGKQNMTDNCVQNRPILRAREYRERAASIADIEKQAIMRTLTYLNGDKLMAAKLLGIGKTTLYRKLKEYGITAEYKASS